MRAADLVQSIWGAPPSAKAANAANSARAPQPHSQDSQDSQGIGATSTIDVLLTAHGDGSAQGVDWTAWRLTTATSSPTWAVATARGLTLLCTVESIPKPRSYPQAWPVEPVAPLPDVEDDLDEEFQERAAILEYDAGLSRAEAEREAAEVIQRARACWNCRNLRATTSATDKRPHCALGHRLVYRATATRTWPGRLDARDCGDRNPGSAT